jgi:hypothetical protein
MFWSAVSAVEIADAGIKIQRAGASMTRIWGLTTLLCGVSYFDAELVRAMGEEDDDKANLRPRMLLRQSLYTN